MDRADRAASCTLPDMLVQARWRTSSRSQTSNCVEFAPLDAGIAVALRDSKDRNGPVLVFDRARWADFVSGAKAGVFDLSGPPSPLPDREPGPIEPVNHRV